MALTELIFGITKAQVGIVQFDASVTETHISETESTDHPIEAGSDVSDHIIKKPNGVEINGIVTNTPVVFLASLLAPSPLTESFLPSLGDRVGDAYAELQRIQDDGETVDVITSLKEYSNMNIASVVVLRDAENGNVLNCTVSLREIMEATTLAVDLPIPVDAAAQAAANAGKVGTTPANPAQSASTLSKMLSAFGG